MKKILLSFFCFFLIATGFGQTTEVTAALDAGLFSFAGRSTTSTSFINDGPSNSYTNNPYGSEPGFSYGLSVGVKRVLLRHLLIGVDAGYEDLRSRVNLNYVTSGMLAGDFSIAATGKTILSSHFIDVEPYVGFRLTPGKVYVDVTGGIDLAHCLSAREKGKAVISNGNVYRTDVDRKTISTDVRPRVQLTAGYRNYAVYAGYSIGLINYMSGYVGGPTGAYGRLVRFGVQYRLWKGKDR